MSITNKLNQIKNAIYGKEVRGAIHDAIKQVYDDASVNHDNANMEVQMARGTHNTLNDRLNNVDQIQAQTNAQLSEKASILDLDVERKRIDSLLKLDHGSTTGDAELNDGRIGAFGEKYDTIGNAIRGQINTINNNKYWKLPVAYFSGGITNSGYDSSNIENVQLNSKTQFIHVAKGDTLLFKNYCLVLFEYGEDYLFRKMTRYESDTNIVFTEDKIIRFYLYKKEQSIINSTTTLSTFVDINEQKEYDKSVSLMLKCSKDRLNYGRYIDGRIGYTGDRKTVYSMPRILKKDTSIYVNGDHKLNLCSISSSNELTSTYSFAGISMSKTTIDGNYIVFIQKYDESAITNPNVFDIELEFIYGYGNKYVDGSLKLAYHRGFSSLRAENTLSAYEYASHYGGKFVECDVEQTLDGELVLMHDSTVDRTTNGNGDIRNLTLEQVKELYVDAPMFVSLYNNTLRVPTLEEFLIYCKSSNLTPVIEVKREINTDKLISLVLKYGFENNCYIQSYNIDILLPIRKINKQIYLALLSDTYSSSVLNSFTRLGKNAGVNFKLDVITTTYVKRFHDLNGFIGGFVSDDYNEMSHLTNLGCDFLITNRLLNKGNTLDNFPVENIYYSSQGTSIDYTIPTNKINLFSDVIHITGQVYVDSNATLTIGDKSVRLNKSKEWNFIDLKFIQKVGGEVKVTLESQDVNFRHILFKIKRYIGE